MGDVNDFSADPPDAAGSEPTSRVLEILAGTAAGFEGGPVLRNVMEFVPQRDRITSWCRPAPRAGRAPRTRHLCACMAVSHASRMHTALVPRHAPSPCTITTHSWHTCSPPPFSSPVRHVH